MSVEVWDTGLGVPDTELQAIFEGRHQVGDAARERSRVSASGPSIVKRLSDLLGHQVSVRSHPGRGSVLALEIAPPHRGAERRSAP